MNSFEGLMGVGWQVSASGAITRCPKTPINDGFVRAVDFTSNDRFCLNGQPLLLKSGSYGGNNSSYFTEIDSFSTITAHGSAGTGPKYFKIENKAGETHYYGDAGAVHSAFSGADAFIEPVGKSTNSIAKAYMLKAIKDVRNRTCSGTKRLA
jgi:hypothetical protein